MMIVMRGKNRSKMQAFSLLNDRFGCLKDGNGITQNYCDWGAQSAV